MSVAYLGIDPGQVGGVALILEDGRAQAWRYPGELTEAVRLLREIVHGNTITLACIEKVQAMPRRRANGIPVQMGSQSSFKFGGNYYGWQWALAALDIPYITVTPQQWQKALLDAGTGETKARSLSMARRIFPDVDLRFKADDGKADALHLARWARRCAKEDSA